MKTKNNSLVKLRTKLITRALLEPEFMAALNESLTEIKSASSTAKNEATIEALFERVLYALLLQIGIKFAPEKESIVDTKRHVGKGRADSRIGSLIIEYKHAKVLKSESGRNKAIKQLSEYAETISHEINSQVRGIITDGSRYYELTAEKGAITAKSGFQPLSTKHLLRFAQAIHSLQLIALTPQNLIRDFARADFEGSIFDSARVLEEQLISGQESEKTTMLRLEWEGLFKLAHDDQSQQKRIQERREVLSKIFRKSIGLPEEEYRALFCLHTAYAITIKLIAFRVVCDLHFGSRQYNFKDYQSADDSSLRPFCERLEDGEIFRDLGFLNLLEGDFFSWYADKAQWVSQIGNCVRGLLEILARYEDVKSVFSTEEALDIFRELYESCVPQVVRASFGEFHTPYWLATKVLDAAHPPKNWTALDPCCGSGTFLIASISKLRSELKGKPTELVLKNILERIAGFDLNPLSVLASRVSYFIHISDLLPDNIQDLTIPVYLGDACYVPEKVNIDGVCCLKYELRTLQGNLDIALPRSLAMKTASFIKNMREVENEIRALDPAMASKLLVLALAKTERKTLVLDTIRSMCEQLAELERKGWNGIWARILSNFLATACLQKFSCVIGNPPWIDWKNLPARYRETIKSLCIDRGLFSGAGRTGGINLNICALITNVSSVNWLASDGHLSFLMPKELSYQASYEGWRKKGPGPGKTILELHDWSAAGHPFDPVKEDFMTFVIGPKSKRRSYIPVLTYSRKKQIKSSARLWKSTAEAESNLKIEKCCADSIMKGSTALTLAPSQKDLKVMSLIAGECAYIGREGIEFYPQELLLFNYISPGPKPGLVFVENIQVQKSKHPVPRSKRLLESEFLYPLVKGPNIKPFCLSDKVLYVPFPYDSSDPIRPIDESILRKRAKLLYEYYRNNSEIIKAQTKFSDKIRGTNPGAYYGLARTGPYSFQKTYVAFRDNTKWCACVVGEIETHWGEAKRMLFQNHAVSMCERSSGKGYITEDEAHYICSILNAPIVERFILHSSDNRSFKIRPPFYLPIFDEKNIIHKKLSELSKLAHSDETNIQSIRKKIDFLYIMLCKKR